MWDNQLKMLSGWNQRRMGKPKDGAGYRFSDIHTTFSEVEGLNIICRRHAWSCSVSERLPASNQTWLEAAHVQPTQGTQKRWEKLLEDYSEVFQDGVGTLTSTKAKLALKEGSQPKFCKARPVPYAIKPKVEIELMRLEREDIIQIKFSYRATAIVLVVKPNGTVRICVNYKNARNPRLQAEEHPLPRTDDIVALELAGGQPFTKIDLKVILSPDGVRRRITRVFGDQHSSRVILI